MSNFMPLPPEAMMELCGQLARGFNALVARRNMELDGRTVSPKILAAISAGRDAARRFEVWIEPVMPKSGRSSDVV